MIWISYETWNILTIICYYYLQLIKIYTMASSSTPSLIDSQAGSRIDGQVDSKIPEQMSFHDYTIISNTLLMQIAVETAPDTKSMLITISAMLTNEQIDDSEKLSQLIDILLKEMIKPDPTLSGGTAKMQKKLESVQVEKGLHDERIKSMQILTETMESVKCLMGRKKQICDSIHSVAKNEELSAAIKIAKIKEIVLDALSSQ